MKTSYVVLVKSQKSWSRPPENIKKKSKFPRNDIEKLTKFEWIRFRLLIDGRKCGRDQKQKNDGPATSFKWT